MRRDNRIQAALARASRRYMKSFYFVGNGARIRIDAIKRDASDDGLEPLSGLGSARLYEFIISAKTFETITAGANGQKRLEYFRKSEIIESDEKGETRYAFVPSRPFLENTPSGGSVRLFTYQNTEK